MRADDRARVVPDEPPGRLSPRRLRGRARRAGALLVLGVALTAPSRARAEVAEAAPRADDQFDFMNVLRHRGLHDLDHETWNAYGQFTHVSSFKLPFDAPYTNANGSNGSLSPEFEHSYTLTFTAYLGAKLWSGAEVHFAPEIIAKRPFSHLKGLGGGIQNFELQRGGSETPELYRARAYFQQTIELGGEPLVKTSDPLQLAHVTRRRRLVLHLGNFSTLDHFDKNLYSGDLRQQLFNLSFMTYAAYDNMSGARGFSWGGNVELFWDDWAIRFGRMASPKESNGLPLDFRLRELYGDQLEVEHEHVLFGQPGAIRVLGYRNRVFGGRFDDALAALQADPSKNAAACASYAFGSSNASAPDFCWVRRPVVKVGLGVNVEQALSADLGFFFRGMYSDGASEVYAYTSTDRSISTGLLGRGARWSRPRDLVGLGVALNWISAAHARYLAAGGVDGFIGDGGLRRAAETVFDAFYSANVLSSAWLSVDYQHIRNPAYNADRGPVNVLGLRVHAEF